MSKATRVVVDGVSYPLDDTTAVDFSEAQSLNAAEKQQARTNIGLGNVDDTSDANKPISTAQQTALNAKLDTANVYNALDKTVSGYALDARQGKVLADKLDATQSGLAIIVDGDAASMAVPVGGYAYIKNNTHGLAEGLYKNTSSAAFPASGGTADGTVFTADSGGALNVINGNLANFVKYNTETATIDNNGYFNTTLKANNNAIISIVSVFFNNVYRNAFRYEVLEYGGSDNSYIALRFIYWDNTIMGKNQSATVKYAYIEI